MRYRDYKQFGPDEFYHIYNRGNGKEIIFIDDQDYLLFINRLKENLYPEENTQRVPLYRGAPSVTDKYMRKILPLNSFELISYCFMPNHFHLLIKQLTELPISKLMLKVCTSYSMYFNKKYKRIGHVFQDQFKAIPVSNDRYLKWLTAYIHQNPSVANITASPEQYRWSSYNEYLGKQGDIVIKKDIVMDQFNGSKDYKKFVEESREIISARKQAEKEWSNLLID